MGIFEDEENDIAAMETVSDEPSFMRNLIKQQKEAKDKKGYLNAFGSALQGAADIPTGYEMIYGKKLAKANPSEALGKIADNIEDPVQRQAKLYEAYKSTKDLEQDKAKRDPNSKASMAAKQIASRFGVQVTPEMSAFDVEQIMDPKKMLETDAQSRVNFNNQVQLRKLDHDLGREERNLKRGERQDALDLKMAEKTEKKKAAINEVEDRRRNIEDNLNLLEQQIKEKGTYEAFGSHNADLDRRVDMIATDMAKLADPTSVARPSEVEMFKKGLLKASATDMRNETALDLLKNFRSEVNTRAANAYKIRGLDDPGTNQAEFVTVYAPNGKAKQIRKDQLDAALAAGGSLQNPSSVAGGR
jgi:hypothetical protein